MEIGPNQEKWLNALESGEYMQGKGQLGVKSGDGECKLCCLGVWLVCSGNGEWLDNRLFDINADNDDESVLEYSWRNLGLHNDSGRIEWSKASCEVARDGDEEICGSLVSLNDSAGWTFAQIAAFSRANPEAVFMKSK